VTERSGAALKFATSPTQTRSQTNFSCGVQRESGETEQGSSSEAGGTDSWARMPWGATSSVSTRKICEGRMTNPPVARMVIEQIMRIARPLLSNLWLHLSTVSRKTFASRPPSDVKGRRERRRFVCSWPLATLSACPIIELLPG
jgi:hypothetical protein